MTQTTQGDTEREGNTKPLSPKKKPRQRARKWCFTYNNYSNTTADYIKQWCEVNDTKYILGFETGDSGTDHIQGYLEFKNAIAFSTVKELLPKAHIEKAKGSTQQNWNYCTKDGDYVSNIDLRPFRQRLKDKCLEKYTNVQWKQWQQDILNLINKEPDERTIHWIWDRNGNIGKTYLCKYIALTKNIIIADGKKNDVFNQVNTAMENEQIPEIIILDVPRSSIGYINYSILEKLKDGLIYSGKYEGGVCCFPNPHIIVFANTEPLKNELSLDRWNIIEVT